MKCFSFLSAVDSLEADWLNVIKVLFMEINMKSPGTLFQFYNCKILRNSKIYQEDLWVRDSKIVNPEPIFYEEKIVADVKIDCKGTMIVPGFIDLQINGGFGIDFSTGEYNEQPSPVKKVAEGLLQHGVTSFCPTVITSSEDAYRKIMPFIKKENGGKHGAGILGVHVEGPFINKEKKGAHPVQYIKELNNGYSDILNTYGNIENICLITIAPELDPDGIVISELVKQGITVSLGHSNSSLSQGETAFGYGASFITHLFNAMLPFHHRDPGLVGLLTSLKIPKDRKVFYGIIADGKHTHPATLRIAFHANPYGLVLVTDAMSAMGLKPGLYCIGEQRVEVKNDRAVVYGTNTLSGSIASMDFCVKFLMESTGCSLEQALECATLHPAQVLGITHKKGTLDFGTDADFILLDNNINVQATYINGLCVWKKEP